ncbi:MAG: PTS glucose transporter subunit IIA [Sporolactobacillus sp.]
MAAAHAARMVSREIIVSPVSGQVLALEAVGDPMFSAGFMGDGAAVLPDNDEVLSPCDGVVAATFPTAHAYGLRTAEGADVLLHLGLDTVKLDGHFIAAYVRKGQQVSKGEPVARVQWNQIAAYGCRAIVIVAVTNSSAYASVRRCCRGHVTAGAPLLTLQPPDDK